MRRQPVVVDDGSAVLGRLKAACREPPSRRIQTVQASCSLPHDWRPALADARGPWWRCARCGDVTRIAP